MKPILIFAVLFLPGLAIYGQTNLQQVIATAGGNSANGSIAIEWTLGEPVIATLSGAGIILTQGFHQTEEIVTAIRMDGLPCKIEIYPNPTGSNLMLTLDNAEKRDFRYSLYDLNGTLLKQELIISNLTVIGMADCPAGIYLLKILQPDKNLKTFEIIKL